MKAIHITVPIIQSRSNFGATIKVRASVNQDENGPAVG